MLTIKTKDYMSTNDEGQHATPNGVKSIVMRRHQLEYCMYSCKVSWCPKCNQHFYNDRNREHTTVATDEHYHEVDGR